jgi:3-hydroxyacyl-[acyl-carrier-protein] dehydratase
MRWLWIDQVLELEPGRRLAAIKNVSLAEEHLHDHFPAEAGLGPLPVVPASLIIEGMAQTAGILVGSARDFREKVILAKIVRAELECDVVPGESLRYEAVIERIDASGAATTGLVSRSRAAAPGWNAIGRIDLLFSHVDRNLSGIALPQHNFVFGENLRILLEAAGLALPDKNGPAERGAVCRQATRPVGRA